MVSEPLRKVTAFVFARLTGQLLVFRHPLAGVQLPAGTVETREDYIAAARREVYEETGNLVQSDGMLLGVESSRLNGDKRVMLASITDGVTHRDGTPGSLIRGHKVRVIQEQPLQHMVKVREEIFDLNCSPPKIIDALDGWAHEHAVGAMVERGFILFYEEGYTIKSEMWSHLADGYLFEVYWSDCDDSLTLVEGQDEWWRRYQPQIMNILRH